MIVVLFILLLTSIWLNYIFRKEVIRVHAKLSNCEESKAKYYEAIRELLRELNQSKRYQYNFNIFTKEVEKNVRIHGRKHAFGHDYD